ncbi:hypothetical protein IMCC20628_01418 [Hoeflea sp. IMCC20628]|uniref:hypothetical protein n=1 Tax=Hoeflea sp. IMCC20628 TaxID=1620421 RepID=UPI00063BE8C9|nr:hypothetical protein [Hoeflea sp. IMCC20628]AKI00135.1 hypothetical protein IMCC20628_01418 [Hoeflea sp. IMCC20628]
MPAMKNGSIFDPVDTQVGGDADIDGIAQTITADDINTVLMSPRSVDQRIYVLRSMRDELEARSHADFGGDMDPLVAEINGALEQLSPQM